MRTSMTVRILLLFPLIATFVFAEAAIGQTTRVSVGDDESEANAGSFNAVLSGDGRYVVFESAASNLVAGDTNATEDVFLRDRLTGATRRISVDSSGVEGNGSSVQPWISDDGRFIVFESAASNLVAGDTNGVRDIFLHDRLLSITTRISESTAGAQGGGESLNPYISPDGRFVAFQSVATNLVAGDTNGEQDIFLHNTQTGTTSRVSVDSAGNEANDASDQAALSADGRFVVFDSIATDLVAGDTNSSRDIFLHDTQTGTTTRVNVDDSGTEANGFSDRAVISDDGRFVAFESNADNLVAGDTNGFRDTFVRDTVEDITTRVSVDSGGNEANGTSQFKAISGDGRFVAIVSGATNLVAGDTNGVNDIFLHDRQTGQTTRASVDSLGMEANGDSIGPSLSNDGRYVVFHNDASNLISGDANAASDVFLHDRVAAQGSTGSIVFVDSVATGNNDGSSWADAYTDLQDGLNDANTLFFGAEVWVRAGGYLPVTGDDQEVTFGFLEQPASPIRVLGGFFGDEVSAVERNAFANFTVLSGDVGVMDDVSDNTFSVFTLIDRSNITIDGLTIIDGNANGTGPALSRFGGGVFVSGDSENLIFENCLFASNGADADESGGGAVAIVDAETTGTAATFTRCQFTGNMAMSPNSAQGGAVYIGSVDGTGSGQAVTDFNLCDFSANRAMGATLAAGGAIAVNEGDVGVFNSLLFLNQCDASAEFGGAINIESSGAPIALLEVGNCTITQNTAAVGAGVSSIGGQTDAQVTNSIVWNNSIGTAFGSTAGGLITASHTIFEESDGSSSNLALDPDFVDPLMLNFRLNPMTSVAVDSGDNLGSFGGSDLDANNRIINSTIDRGAFETPVGADTAQPAASSFVRFDLAPQSTTETTLLWELTFNQPVNIPPNGAFTIENDPGVNGPFELTVGIADDTGRSYIVVLEVGGGSGNVFLSLDLPSVSTVYNVAGTGSIQSPPYSLGSGVDTTPPSVQSIALQGSELVGGGTTQTSWLVTFTEPVTGVDTTVFVATETSGSADTSPSIDSVVDQGGGDAYLVTYNIGEGEFDFRCDLADGKSQIEDLAGNLLDNNSFTNGDEVSVDTIAPTVVAIVTGSSLVTNQPVDYEITFSEPVALVIPSDLEVFEVAGSVPNASIISISGDSDVWTVQVDPGPDADGTLNLGIASGNSIEDLAGNALGETGDEGNSVDVDTIAPMVDSIVDLFQEGPYDVGDTITFDVSFDSDVEDPDPADFDLVSVTGEVIAVIEAINPNSRGTSNQFFTVDVCITGGTGGTLRLDVLSGTIADIAGNVLAATFSGGEVVTVNAAPLPMTYPFVDSVAITSSASLVSAVTAGDLNGDGLLDAAFTAPNSGFVGWLENTGGSPPIFVERLVGNSLPPIAAATNQRGTPPAKGIEIGDVTADGAPDVVVLAGESVVVFRNDGGTPTSFTEVARIAATDGSGLTLADFNGDGLLDLAAASGSADPIVLINDGTNPGANFSTTTILPSAQGGQIRAADLDLDGDMDIVVNDGNNDRIAFALNLDGDGTNWGDLGRGINNGGGGISLADADLDGDLDVFATDGSSVVYYENRFREEGSLAIGRSVGGLGKGGPIDDLPIADFDFDGDPDFVETDGSDLRVRLNDRGEPVDFDALDLLFLSESISSVVAGDFDRDGDQDLLAGYEFGGGESPLFFIENISVARVAGLAQENQFTVTRAQRGPTDAALADIDRDGDLDVIVCSLLDDTLAWYENDGTDDPGAFTQRIIADFTTTNARPDGPIKLDVGDIGGDGDLDVVVASLVDGAIHLYENGVADVGVTAFAHTQVASAASTPGAVAIGDIDRDGLAEILFGDGDELWAIDVDVNPSGNNRGGFQGSTIVLGLARLADGAANGNADIRDLRIIDLNGDGQMDVISGANSFANGMSHVLGRTLTGTFPPAIAPALGFMSAGGESVTGLGVDGADYDGDGDIDIAHTTVGTSVQFQGITPSSYAVDLLADSVRDLATADIDLDGKPDLIAASSLENTVAWLRNVLDQSAIATSEVSALAPNVQEVEAGDVTQNGFSDIVSVAFASDAVTLHRNTGGEATVTPLAFPGATPVATALLVLEVQIDHPGGKAGLRLEELTIDLDDGTEGQSVVLDMSIDGFELWRDAGGTGFDQGEDTLVGTTMLPFGPTAGVMIAADMGEMDDPVILPGERGVFFVVARLGGNPPSAQFRATLAGAASIVLSDAAQIAPLRAARFDALTTGLISVGSNGSLPTPGDADGDGFTTTSDLTFVISNLGAGA
ncbi:MAG: FG-GAP-like repeat-containing protein, partial [Planctomycetota bacterium]